MLPLRAIASHYSRRQPYVEPILTELGMPIVFLFFSLASVHYHYLLAVLSPSPLAAQHAARRPCRCLAGAARPVQSANQNIKIMDSRPTATARCSHHATHISRDITDHTHTHTSPPTATRDRDTHPTSPSATDPCHGNKLSLPISWSTKKYRHFTPPQRYRTKSRPCDERTSYNSPYQH